MKTFNQYNIIAEAKFFDTIQDDKYYIGRLVKTGIRTKRPYYTVMQLENYDRGWLPIMDMILNLKRYTKRLLVFDTKKEAQNHILNLRGDSYDKFKKLQPKPYMFYQNVEYITGKELKAKLIAYKIEKSNRKY